MSFRNRVARLYETTANAPWKEDLAHTLFSDSVVSQLESWHSETDEDHSNAEDLLDELQPAGGDITEAVKDVATKEHISNLSEFYDFEQIDQMDQALRKILHVTLEDVYNKNPMWAHHIVMNFIGHGVSPFDDNGFQSWLQYESGATKLDWRQHPHFESPYDGAQDFIDKVLNQRRGADDGKEEQEDEEGTHASYGYGYGIYDEDEQE